MKKFLIIMMFFVFVVFPVNSVFSQTPDSAMETTDYCREVVNLIAQRIQTSQKRADDHNKFITEWKGQLPNSQLGIILKDAQKLELDTSKLQGDIASREKLIDTYDRDWNSDFSAYIDLLKITQSFKCGESNGQFLQSLSRAKNTHRKFILDRANNKELIYNLYIDIRSDISKLREEAKDK